MQTAAEAAAARVAPLLDQAKILYAAIYESEAKLLATRDELVMRAFRLGAVLIEMKEVVGHGRWLFWLGANWPELGERSARRCMTLFRDNDAKSAESADLTADSIRQFLWGYIPPKDRPALDGDKTITPHPHPLTFVNNFTKWDRQAELGLITRPAVEVLRVDLAPVVRRMAELGGREWIEELLNELPA